MLIDSNSSSHFDVSTKPTKKIKFLGDNFKIPMKYNKGCWRIDVPGRRLWRKSRNRWRRGRGRRRIGETKRGWRFERCGGSWSLPESRIRRHSSCRCSMKQPFCFGTEQKLLLLLLLLMTLSPSSLGIRIKKKPNNQVLFFFPSQREWVKFENFDGVLWKDEVGFQHNPQGDEERETEEMKQDDSTKLKLKFLNF